MGFEEVRKWGVSGAGLHSTAFCGTLTCCGQQLLCLNHELGRLCRVIPIN